MKNKVKIFVSLFLALVMLLSFPSFANAVSKPEKTYITSLSANVKGFTVKWKKKNVTGYQIQYALNSSFKNGKKVTVKSKTTTSKKVKHLKAKRTYFVRVRTYKAKDGKRTYSSWSKYKSVKTKKSKSRTVYITETGSCYHYDSNCGNGVYYRTTLSKALSLGLRPCKKCVY
ncbi:MAG: fibronectin type III domain-containing protein [Eubacterium sp.]|nr:fibronectin type III domain-containing protein [Eubacterium sp.]